MRRERMADAFKRCGPAATKVREVMKCLLNFNLSLKFETAMISETLTLQAIFTGFHRTSIGPI